MKTTPLKTVILSAPQGWGKGIKTPKLLREFGCTHVAADDWRPGETVTPGALHLTNVPPSELRNNKPELYSVVARGWPA